MVFLHVLPVEYDPELLEKDEDEIAQEDYQVEVLGAERAATVLLEDPVSHIELIAVFAV